MEPLTLVALGVAAVVVALLVARRSVSPASPQTGLLKPSIIKPTPEMKISTKATGRRYLVVGGSGFLGSHIVEALLARGEQHVRIFDQRETLLFKDHPKVEFVLGNILNKDDCKKAVKGIDSVFHTAAVIDYWSRFDFQRPLSYAVNVTGLENVLAASVAEGVKRFVYTSSSNVILGSGESIKNGDESWPYPARPNNHYSETKALAEKAVLAANGKNGILTGAVRPNGIFGPRDNIMAESVYRAGKPEPMLCKGNIQDWVYVENVVHAQLLLEGALSDSPSSPAGKTYCIAGDRPMEYIEFWTKLARTHNTNRAVGGKDEDIVVLPKPLVWALASISESLTWLSRGNLKGQFFKLTPAVLTIAMADIYLNYSRAKKDFGFEPPYTMEEAFEQCSRFYQPEATSQKRKTQ